MSSHSSITRRQPVGVMGAGVSHAPVAWCHVHALSNGFKTPRLIASWGCSAGFPALLPTFAKAIWSVPTAEESARVPWPAFAAGFPGCCCSTELAGFFSTSRRCCLLFRRLLLTRGSRLCSTARGSLRIFFTGQQPRSSRVVAVLVRVASVRLCSTGGLHSLAAQLGGVAVCTSTA